MRMNRIVFTMLMGALLCAPQTVHAITEHPFPRKANYFLNWEITNTQATELSKWDLLILDMETQKTSPEALKKIRQENPDVIILAYITAQEIASDAAHSTSQMRRSLAANISSQWYVTNSSGNTLGYWPGTTLLNVSSVGPTVSGRSFQDMLSDFVTQDILESGYWDGVFFDNAWADVTWATGNDIDLNKDGKIDTSPNTAWREGLKTLYKKTKEKAPEDTIVVVNGTSREFSQDVNGSMIENFVAPSWEPTMNTYAYYGKTSLQPDVNVINANTGNTGNNTDYKHMRFTLSSALMEDGYYSFTFGDQDHGQLWWYDEYDSDLGNPIAEAKGTNGNNAFSTDVWTREFEHGIAVVNSTGEKKRITLGGEYEAIRGEQDTAINNGRIMSTIDVDAYDGQLLLKTFENLRGTIFTNGSFVRFFRPDGERVRNGYFAFEDVYKGGEQIARMDLDGNGIDDLIEVKGNKIRAWKDNGQPFFTLWPYTAQYTGTLRIAIGNINGGKQVELIVAPAFGDGAYPIRIYTLDGLHIVEEWYPFGKEYTGGYSVAMGNVDYDPFGEIIIGAGKGRAPVVSVYSHNLALQHEWMVYEATFKGGVNVAVGSLDGDSREEVVASPGPGGKPYIRSFDGFGTQIGETFTAYQSIDSPGIDVRITDVDFDGKGDIVGMSSGL